MYNPEQSNTFLKRFRCIIPCLFRTGTWFVYKNVATVVMVKRLRT